MKGGPIILHIGGLGTSLALGGPGHSLRVSRARERGRAAVSSGSERGGGGGRGRCPAGVPWSAEGPGVQSPRRPSPAQPARRQPRRAPRGALSQPLPAGRAPQPLTRSVNSGPAAAVAEKRDTGDGDALTCHQAQPRLWAGPRSGGNTPPPEGGLGSLSPHYTAEGPGRRASGEGVRGAGCPASSPDPLSPVPPDPLSVSAAIRKNFRRGDHF